MTEPNQINQVLSGAPRPDVVAGAHREFLKERLVRAANTPLSVQEAGSGFSGNRSLRIAAALLICMLLVGAGWAAEKAYKAVKKMYVVSTVESLRTENESPIADLSFRGNTNEQDADADASGDSLTSMSGVFTMTEGASAQDAKRKTGSRLREIEKLIVEKDYELIKTVEGSGDGEQYIYQFEMPDGEKQRMNFSMPLESVASWEDYQKKAAQQRLQREKNIAESIKAGRFPSYQC